MQDLILLFEMRASVYGLLSSLYLSPPDESLLTGMRSPAFLAEWPLGRGDVDVETGLARLEKALPAVTAASVREEFWRLFGTLGPADAHPWQSVYLDRERVPFGEETLRIRALFAQFGLASVQSGRHPDDHIGLELEFLARLAARTAEFLAGGDEAGASRARDGQRTCLEEHLLRWAEPFVSRVEAASTSGFYAGLARLTLGVIRSDRDWFSEQV